VRHRRNCRTPRCWLRTSSPLTQACRVLDGRGDRRVASARHLVTGSGKGGVPEGEDTTAGADQQVATTVRRGADPNDGCAQLPVVATRTSWREAEARDRPVVVGIPESEDATIRGDEPLSQAIRRGCDADNRSLQGESTGRAVERRSPKARTPPSAPTIQ